MQINNPYLLNSNFNKLEAKRDYSSRIIQDPLDDIRRESQMIKSGVQEIVHNDDVRLKYIDQDGQEIKQRRSMKDRRHKKNKSMVYGKSLKQDYADQLMGLASIDDPIL